MGSNWKTYTMDELYDVSSGLSKKREEFGFGYPFLTFKEVFHNIFVPESLPELANTTEKERERCSIKKGDVFLTRTSEKLEELGLSCVALKDYENATFNGFTKRLRPNDLCNKILLPEYAAFYFSSNAFRNQVTSFASMTTRASLNNEMISKLKIDVPSLYVQKQIANIMRNLLQKEQLNNQMVKNLEKIAVELFKRWFIDFEFPNEQGLPYRSSGGEMVESELGKIPKEWRVEKLNYLAEIIMGQSPKGTSYNFEFEGLPLVNGASDFKGGEINPSKYTTEPKKISQKGDYIFGVRATLGNVTETQGEYAIGRGAGIARSRELKYKEYLYFQLVSAFNSFEHTASGSVYLNISKNDLNDYKIVVPTNRLLQKFHETTSAMLKKKEELIQENINLKTLRDTLLPKLLSGEIEIRDESVVEPS